MPDKKHESFSTNAGDEKVLCIRCKGPEMRQPD